MRRAVFLDRDGVLNGNIFYADTGCWEAPRVAREFRLLPEVLPALRDLRRAGFVLFVVSNQPNVAKGKTSPQEFQKMQRLLADQLRAGGVELEAAFYCMHHPLFTGPCKCRKPSSHFLLEAARMRGIALEASWMIGDRVTDVECGRSAGVRTIWIDTGQEPERPDPSACTAVVRSLSEGVRILLASPGA